MKHPGTIPDSFWDFGVL